VETNGTDKPQIRRGSPQSVTNIQVSYSGPLPQPEVLERYERAVPGSAGRIFKQFEEQSAHRRAIESRVISSNTFCQVLGSVSALLVGLLAIGGGLYLVHEGKSVVGLVALLGTMASLAGVYVYGKRDQNAERRAKALNRSSE